MDDDDILNFSFASIVNGKSTTAISKSSSKSIGKSASGSSQTTKTIDVECLIDLTEEVTELQNISNVPNSKKDKSESKDVITADNLWTKNAQTTSKTTNKRKKKTPEEREQEEQEKALRKAQKEQDKEAERQRKQKEKEEARKKKLEERRNNKRKTLEDCLMEIFIKLDSKLVSSKGGGEILAALQGKDLNVDFAQLPIPHSVEWLRKKDTSLTNSQNVDENSMDSASLEEISSGQIVEHKNVLCEIVNQVLVRICGDTLLEMLHNNTAQPFVKNVLTAHPNKSIIFLLESVGEALKKDNREQTKAFKNSGNVTPPLTKQDIDKFVVWLQVEALCNARQTNSLGESIDFIFRLSMAIATAPYSLMLMYESEGLTKKNKEELLASITREDTANGAGRKLGVSISTKIYRVFNEVDGAMLVQDL